MPNLVTICLEGDKAALIVSVNRATPTKCFAVLESQGCDLQIIWPVFERDAAEMLRTLADACNEAAAELSGPADAE